MIQNVYTLLCQRDLQMARVTLPGILKFLNQEQNLFIFDDGSLNADAINELSDMSSLIIVKTRNEREQWILDKLGKRPNCINYRNEYPFGFKLIDIPLFAAEDKSSRYTYTDTDIIYLKDCSAYFTRNVNTYLRTDAIKLSVKLQDVFFKYGWKIPYKFNAGYFSYNASAYDLDFVEYFLGLPEARNTPWLIEQTCWSLIFQRSGGTSLCPAENQFVCRERFEGPNKDTLAIHLIAGLKSKLVEWSEYKDCHQEHRVIPQFEKSRNVNLLDWARKSAIRFFPIL